MNDHVNFDGRAARFRDRIYGSAKGELRLSLIWRDMLETIPELSAPRQLQIWDAGGGLGQISARLAALGHAVLLTDASAEMLRLAEAEISGYRDRVQIKCAPIAATAADSEHRFDVVVCHAVLEWLSAPQQALAALLSTLRPGGALSLMFYNVNAMVLGNMVKGNLRKLSREDFAGDPGSFTPPTPLRPHEVVAWLETEGVRVEHRRSVRLAYDLLSKKLRSERSLNDIEALEWQYGAREPFWQLGRYVHLVARKPQEPGARG